MKEGREPLSLFWWDSEVDTHKEAFQLVGSVSLMFLCHVYWRHAQNQGAARRVTCREGGSPPPLRVNIIKILVLQELYVPDADLILSSLKLAPVSASAGTRTRCPIHALGLALLQTSCRGAASLARQATPWPTND